MKRFLRPCGDGAGLSYGVAEGNGYGEEGHGSVNGAGFGYGSEGHGDGFGNGYGMGHGYLDGDAFPYRSPSLRLRRR